MTVGVTAAPTLMVFRTMAPAGDQQTAVSGRIGRES